MNSCGSVLVIFPPAPEQLVAALKYYFPEAIFDDPAKEVVQHYIEQHPNGLTCFLEQVEISIWLKYSGSTRVVSDKIDALWRASDWWGKTRQLLVAFYAQYTEEVTALFGTQQFEPDEVLDSALANGTLARVNLLADRSKALPTLTK